MWGEHVRQLFDRSREPGTERHYCDLIELLSLTVFFNLQSIYNEYYKERSRSEVGIRSHRGQLWVTFLSAIINTALSTAD